MTKGLTGLVPHNSNMVAPHKQNYDGGHTIYQTKKLCWKDKQALKKDIPFFDQVLDDSCTIRYFLSTSYISNRSSNAKMLCADVV